MTELPIDQSNLPRVQEVRRDFSVLEDGALAHCLQEQEIEQHYASNIQKNKLVQKDIRIAKKLQDEEDERNKIRSLEKKRQIEERDSEYARVIQEELRRKAEECRRREEEDKEIAKRLQELEQEEVQRWSHDSPTRIPGRPSVLSHENHDTEGSRTQLPTLTGELSMQPEHADQLEYRMAELELQSSDQLLRDEELARRLQEEEEKELTTARHQGQTEDFRAAQVAQDEEIAKYIQRQELKSRRRSEDSDVRRESIDESSSTGSSSEQRRQSTDQLNDVTASQVQRVSEDITTPRENSMQERFTFLTKDGTDVDKHLTPINIAEELDPTFKSKRKEFPADVFTGCSQECSGPPQTHAVPLDGFYDFMDDPADPPFVSPTKRQSDKLGRQKSRDKRENCKQQ
ncbi:coiled-coil domain-containing protein 50-like isoform X5 [Ambystoma mexicanum]|uniref:coiled-coil domain-containing protein 50-like isoform X5 n=1 Tax=Ambystoma mexicanum TaxID=8296 RepID=UPI0037E7BC07